MHNSNPTMENPVLKGPRHVGSQSTIDNVLEQAATGLETKGKKVLVHSSRREARAITGRVYKLSSRTNRYEALNIWRQFVNHRSYMTPEEAEFLVASAENQAYIDAGMPAKYSYPAGMPYPVPLDFEGPFFKPMTDDSISLADPRQQMAAAVHEKEIAAAQERDAKQLSSEGRTIGEAVGAEGNA